MMKKEQGFTLIELMVVVLIIAILVAIAVPVFTSARESAWRRTCQANLRTIDGAIQTYNASYDGVPAAMVDTVDGDHPLVAGGFLKRAPQCPKAVSAGNAGYYTITGDYTDPQDLKAECPGNYPNHTY
jgi:type IV pilus assembly protein PilA